MATAKKNLTSKSKFYLYKVSLSRGRTNKNFSLWLQNVTPLGARAGGYGGIDKICLIAHPLDAGTIAMLCSAGMETDEERAEVTAKEITEDTLKPHAEDSNYEGVVNNYFREKYRFHHIKPKQP